MGCSNNTKEQNDKKKTGQLNMKKDTVQKGAKEYACALSIAIFSVKMYILYVYIYADSSFFSA